MFWVLKLGGFLDGGTPRTREPLLVRNEDGLGDYPPELDLFAL